jgi:hypothetical protein
LQNQDELRTVIQLFCRPSRYFRIFSFLWALFTQNFQRREEIFASGQFKLHGLQLLISLLLQRQVSSDHFIVGRGQIASRCTWGEDRNERVARTQVLLSGLRLQEIVGCGDRLRHIVTGAVRVRDDAVANAPAVAMQYLRVIRAATGVCSAHGRTTLTCACCAFPRTLQDSSMGEKRRPECQRHWAISVCPA